MKWQILFTPIRKSNSNDQYIEHLMNVEVLCFDYDQSRYCSVLTLKNKEGEECCLEQIV